LIFVLAALLYTAPAPEARGQVVYGISELSFDPSTDTISGYSATEMDYYACLYYDAYVEGYLSSPDVGLIDAGSDRDYCTAQVDTYAYDALSGTEYDLISDHYVVDFFDPYYDDYYDAFSFSLLGGGDHGGGYDFFGCDCPIYIAEEYIFLGSTGVGGITPVNTPTLDGPSSITRGGTATFTIQNLDTNAQISNWAFTDAATNSTTVTRSSHLHANSWSGAILASGSVSVKVIQGGRTFNLSQAITVNPREGFFFIARPVTEVPNGFTMDDGTVLNVGTPQTFNGALGHTGVQQYWSWPGTSQVNDGPNKGYIMANSAADTAMGGSPTTAAHYTIMADLENTSSAFYTHQCGDYDPVNKPNGFISGANLLHDTIGHEIGSFHSHNKQYVDAQNNPSNNLGILIESFVRPPPATFDSYSTDLDNAARSNANVIATAISAEPCGSGFVLNDNCQTDGRVNWDIPYAACGTSGGGSPPGNSAAFVSMNVPTAMIAGSSYSVTVVMTNSGTNAWSGSGGYYLGSQDPQDNTTWGLNRFCIPGTVGPGSQASITFNITAPATPGFYYFQWRLLQSGVAWFGYPTAAVLVQVGYPYGCDWTQQNNCYWAGGTWNSSTCTCQYPGNGGNGGN
jgi:hypothetical protein